jgi:hypothetical protein
MSKKNHTYYDAAPKAGPDGAMAGFDDAITSLNQVGDGGNPLGISDNLAGFNDTITVDGQVVPHPPTWLHFWFVVENDPTHVQAYCIRIRLTCQAARVTCAISICISCDQRTASRHIVNEKPDPFIVQTTSGSSERVLTGCFTVLVCCVC